MSVGTQIRKAREATGLTQKQLAEQLGVSPSAVANYENDISHPKESIFINLFSTLKVDANYLYYDDFIPSDECDYTPDEKILLKQYRTLDIYGKQLVTTVVNLEHERMIKQL